MSCMLPLGAAHEDSDDVSSRVYFCWIKSGATPTESMALWEISVFRYWASEVLIIKKVMVVDAASMMSICTPVQTQDLC